MASATLSSPRSRPLPSIQLCCSGNLQYYFTPPDPNPNSSFDTCTKQTWNLMISPLSQLLALFKPKLGQWIFTLSISHDAFHMQICVYTPAQPNKHATCTTHVIPSSLFA